MSITFLSGRHANAPLVADALDNTVSGTRSFLRDRLHVTDVQMDRGVPRLVWPGVTEGQLASSPPQIQAGLPDGQAAEEEVLQEAYRRLEEVRFGTSALATELCSGSDTADNVFCFFRAHSSFLPPWLLDDGDPQTSVDGDLRSRIDAIVDENERVLRGLGLTVGSPAYNDRLVNGLILMMQMPRDQGGLGLSYYFLPDQSHFRRTGIEAYQAAQGDCNSFSFIFFAMARRAGLDPVFIRISGQRNPQTRQMEELHHVGVAVRLDPSHPSQLTIIDPSRGIRLNATESQWYTYTSLEMMGNHLRNVALNNAPAGLSTLATPGRYDWQEERLLQGFRMAPNDYTIATAFSRFYTDRRGDTATALRYARRAASINPSFQGIWGGTAVFSP